jgi:hypothetical protein
MAKNQRTRAPLGPFKDIAISDLDPTDSEHRDLVRREVLKLSGILEGLERAAGVEPSLRVEQAPFRADSKEIGTSVTRLERAPRNPSRPSHPIVDPVTFHKGSWNDTVYGILHDAGRPITYDELRTELGKTRFAQKIDSTGKVYYAVIQKLRELGLCQSYKGRIGTPENIKKFQDEVAAGRASDVHVARYRNPTMEAILVLLEERRTETTFREIVNYLEAAFKRRTDPNWEISINILLRRMVSDSPRRIMKVRRGIYKIRDESGEMPRVEMGSASAVH